MRVCFFVVMISLLSSQPSSKKFCSIELADRWIIALISKPKLNRDIKIRKNTANRGWTGSRNRHLFQYRQLRLCLYWLFNSIYCRQSFITCCIWFITRMNDQCSTNNYSLFMYLIRFYHESVLFNIGLGDNSSVYYQEY